MTRHLLLDLVWKGQLYWNEMVYTISLVGARPAKDPIGRNEWKVWQVNESHKVHTRNCDMLLGTKSKPMSHTGFNHLMTEAYQQRHAYVHAKQPRSLMHETEFLQLDMLEPDEGPHWRDNIGFLVPKKILVQMFS